MTQSAKEALKAKLADLGLNQTIHNKAKKGYDGLTSNKSVQDRLNHVDAIGAMIDKVKEHLASKKTNMNSGEFGDYMTTYFPRIDKRQFSVYRWYHLNKAEVDKWNMDQKAPVGNPERLRKNLMAALKKDDKADSKSYEAYGLNEPKDKVQSKDKEEGAKDDNQEKVITAKSLDNMSNAEILGWISTMSNRLKQRVRNSKASFSGDDVKDLERLSLELADVQIAATIEVPENKHAETSAS